MLLHINFNLFLELTTSAGLQAQTRITCKGLLRLQTPRPLGACEVGLQGASLGVLPVRTGTTDVALQKSGQVGRDSADA